MKIAFFFPLFIYTGEKNTETKIIYTDSKIELKCAHENRRNLSFNLCICYIMSFPFPSGIPESIIDTGASYGWLKKKNKRETGEKREWVW